MLFSSWAVAHCVPEVWWRWHWVLQGSICDLVTDAIERHMTRIERWFPRCGPSEVCIHIQTQQAVSRVYIIGENQVAGNHWQMKDSRNFKLWESINHKTAERGGDHLTPHSPCQTGQGNKQTGAVIKYWTASCFVKWAFWKPVPHWPLLPVMVVYCW